MMMKMIKATFRVNGGGNMGVQSDGVILGSGYFTNNPDILYSGGMSN